MRCPYCGTENQDTNRHCTNCNYDFSANWGNQTNQQPNGWQVNQNVNNYPVYQKPFQSYLAMSIVSIFFFTILGIIATVMSSQANSAFRIGNYALAESKAHTAKTLAILSFALGSLLIIGRLCSLS